MMMGNYRKGEMIMAIDPYVQMRDEMIDRMRDNLRQIRNIIGYTTIEFSERMGIARQTLNNLEAGRVRISAAQYLAICCIIEDAIDNEKDINGQSTIAGPIDRLLNPDSKTDIIDNPNNRQSLIKRWFLTFDDKKKKNAKSRMTLNDKDIMRLARNYNIFLDETVFYVSEVDRALDSLTNALQAENKQYIVSTNVIHNIEGIVNDIEKGKKYRDALLFLFSLRNEEMVAIRADDNELNVIDSYIAVFAQYKLKNRMALMTQDKNRAKRILGLNAISQQGFDIVCLYIKDGQIHFYDIDELNKEDQKDDKEEKSEKE